MWSRSPICTSQISRSRATRPIDSGMAGDQFRQESRWLCLLGTGVAGPQCLSRLHAAANPRLVGRALRDFNRTGIDGFWNDMNEPSVFDSPTSTMPWMWSTASTSRDSPRTATHAEIHNVYGMENSRATFDGLLALKPDVRPFVLTRATYAGGQRYAATWTGDNSSTWNHLRMTTPMLEESRPQRIFLRRRRCRRIRRHAVRRNC